MMRFVMMMVLIIIIIIVDDKDGKTLQPCSVCSLAPPPQRPTVNLIIHQHGMVLIMTLVDKTLLLR